MISEIFVNGDSFSAPAQDVVPYSVHLGQMFNVPVTNFAVAGSSNDRLFRSTLEYCLNLSDQQTPLIVIGFSFVDREETWIDEPSKWHEQARDFTGSKFLSTMWLTNQTVDETTMHLIIDQNINQQMINFYTKLFMFTQTLKQLKIPYFLFSAANNQDFRKLDWSCLKNLNMYNYVQSDACVLDIHGFNMRIWAETNQVPINTYHYLYNDGHKKFAEFLHGQINDTLCKR